MHSQFDSQSRFEYIADRMFHEMRDFRRQLDELRREQHETLRFIHTFTTYVDRFDPRIRDGYLMEQRFKESSK